MNVLLSNDDGITSPGIAALYESFSKGGHRVFAVAPMRQQSGVSHAITVFEPLRVQEYERDGFSGLGVFGTPADCVKLALADLAPWPVDLVVAGINLGRNVGPDVFYSGTIGAAAEGAHSGVASIAASHANWQAQAHDLAAAADFIVNLAEDVKWDRLKRGRVVNVNFPNLPPGQEKGARLCSQAPAVWINAYSRRHDPRGWPYWWMEGETEKESIPPDSDMALLAGGWITITPLKFEHTDQTAMASLADMKIAALTTGQEQGK